VKEIGFLSLCGSHNFMARPYRLQGENCFYHITSRGDDRKRIFLNDKDYKKFFEYVLTAKQRFKFYVYAYCLMPNHYHLLLETTQPNLSAIMHYVNSSYTTFYNIKHKRCGHLLQGRFKSIVVDKDSYLQELSRYIHLNPVRSNIADNPDKYLWSSFMGYMGKKDDIIDLDKIKTVINMNSNQYRSFDSRGL